VIVVGFSHHTAPIEVRERLAVPSDELPLLLDRIRGIDVVEETMVLSTCNRVEVYCAAQTAERGPAEAARRIAAVLSEVGGHQVAPYLSTHSGREGLRHMFRVAASLDSLVVGEPQVLGQFKEAMRIAESAGTLGPRLGAAARRALHVAKQVRSQTAIGAGKTSVPTVAVSLAQQIFDQLAGREALLVGAGETAETAARKLAHAGARLRVINRHAKRAERLATVVGGKPAPWSDMEAALVRADIVITSTASPHHVITKQLLGSVRRARRGRSLFLIDIAVPRDVEPSVHDLDNVYLYDIDDLSRVVAQSRGTRAAEARQAEAMVQAEVVRFEARRSRQAVTPAIVALRGQWREQMQAELDRSLKSKLKHLSAADRKALGRLLEAMANKLLHAPTTRLKSLAAGPHAELYARTLCHLFDLEERVEATRQDEEPAISIAPADSEERAAAAESLEGAGRPPPPRTAEAARPSQPLGADGDNEADKRAGNASQ